MKKKIYFDNAASSLRSEFFVESFCSELGKKISYRKKKEILDLIQNKISNFLNVQKDCISFTPNATYAINEIVFEIFKDKKNLEKKIYLSNSEHSSNHVIWLNFAKKYKKKINYFELNKFKNFSFEEENIIISFSILSNLEGIKVSLKDVNEKFKNLKNSIVIIDAAQYIQHFLINLKDFSGNFLFFSAHKFFGPNGIGILYSKDKNISLGINSKNFFKKFSDYDLDWASLKAWSISFSESEEFYKNEKFSDYEKTLNDYFVKNFPKNNFVELINKKEKNSIFLLRIRNEDISSHDFCFFLYQNNVIVRPGFSCSYIYQEKYSAHELLRISLSFKNKISEIDFFFDLIKNFKISKCI